MNNEFDIMSYPLEECRLNIFIDLKHELFDTVKYCVFDYLLFYPLSLSTTKLITMMNLNYNFAVLKKIKDKVMLICFLVFTTWNLINLFALFK